MGFSVKCINCDLKLRHEAILSSQIGKQLGKLCRSFCCILHIAEFYAITSSGNRFCSVINRLVDKIIQCGCGTATNVSLTEIVLNCHHEFISSELCRDTGILHMNSLIVISHGREIKPKSRVAHAYAGDD